MIPLPERFDDIRPYYDSEIPQAMQRISLDPLLPVVLRYLGQEERLPAVQELLRSIRTTEQLQKTVMLPICRKLTAATIDRLTYDGLENVLPGQGQLFVSNHRDIVMDAFLQQMALLENGLPTSHVTFGSNLMEPQFVVDIGLANKMFKTVRKSDDFQSFLDSSVHLSDYINHVTSHGESVWIAQRNGRTKDGYDKTEPGLLRMLLLGGDKKKALGHLNITPVSVSYQWEPCDALKASELMKSLGGKPYVKAKGEDLNSIVTGIVSPKGNVNVSICSPVRADGFSDHLTRAEMASVVREIDEKIYGHYKLWDTNYAAFDILNSSCTYADFYSAELKEALIDRMEKALESSGFDDKDTFRTIFLKIYSGPVETSGK